MNLKNLPVGHLDAAGGHAQQLLPPGHQVLVLLLQRSILLMSCFPLFSHYSAPHAHPLQPWSGLLTSKGIDSTVRYTERQIARVLTVLRTSL